MSSNKSLYVQFNQEQYRSGKAADLNAQSDLLRMMKHVRNLRILAKQRQELREKLLKLFEQVVKHTYAVDKKFPDPEIPKHLIKKKPRVEKSDKLDKLDLKIKRDYSKQDEIDAELFDIQKKLKMLNS